MEKLGRSRTGGSPGASMRTTKRKLDFSVQQEEGRRMSAKGRCFYLDLVGKEDLTAQYQQELTRRGAVVSQFFDKSVEVLVTNRSGSGGRPSGSPATNPSPALASLSRQSPFSNSPRTSIESSNGNMALSRGKMIAEMVNKKRGQKSSQNDLVTKATDWGTKVWNISKLEEFLLATKSQAVATSSDRRKHSKTGSSGGRGVPKVRALRAPFIKVEDRSRAYKPLVLEVKAWPTPNLQCSPEGSPFDSPPHKEKTRLAERPVRLARVTPKQPVVPLEEKKAGYCECCRAHFTDAKMHLNGEQHLAFAADAKNYEVLDRLISQGKSFDDFLSKYAKVTVQTAAPDIKPAVVEHTPGFITPAVVQTRKRGLPSSSGSGDNNSPKRLKLVLSPSSHPSEAQCAVDSGVCLPDHKPKSQIKKDVVSTDAGQSPVLRSSRKRSASNSDAMDETPIPDCGTKKWALSPCTLTPDQNDTPTPVRHSPRLNGKVTPLKPVSKSPLALSSPAHKELVIVLERSPKTPCSQATTVSVTPRKDVVSSASSIMYQPTGQTAGRRKSLRHLARKLQNNDVSPDAEWKQEQRQAFQLSFALSFSSSLPCTPTRSIPSSAQPSPRSGLGSVSCGQSGITKEVETSSSRRQMPARHCKGKRTRKH